MKGHIPLTILALAACLPEDTQDDAMTYEGQVTTQVEDTSESTAESRLAKRSLDALQAQSFAENTEFCGYILRNAAGDMVTSEIALQNSHLQVTSKATRQKVSMDMCRHPAAGFGLSMVLKQPSANFAASDVCRRIRTLLKV